MKTIPIEAVKRLQQTYGGEGVIVFHVDRTTGEIGCISYGVDRARCQAMQQLGSAMMDAVLDEKIEMPE